MTATATASARLRVLIPGLLVSYTGGARTVDLTLGGERSAGEKTSPPRLADALAALDVRYPGMRFRLVDEQGKIRPHVRMFIDAEQARDLAAALPAKGELMIVGALSGG